MKDVRKFPKIGSFANGRNLHCGQTFSSIAQPCDPGGVHGSAERDGASAAWRPATWCSPEGLVIAAAREGACGGVCSARSRCPPRRGRRVDGSLQGLDRRACNRGCVVLHRGRDRLLGAPCRFAAVVATGPQVGFPPVSRPPPQEARTYRATPRLGISCVGATSAARKDARTRSGLKQPSFERYGSALELPIRRTKCVVGRSFCWWLCRVSS